MTPIFIAHAAFLPERRAHVERMLENLPTAKLVESLEKVHAKVWFRRVVEAAIVAGGGPFCMLNDDVDTAPNFQDHVDALVAAAPGRMIALHSTAAAAPSLIMCGERWLSSFWMTGPGMIIPDAKACLDWLDGTPDWIWHSQNEDGVLMQWAYSDRQPILHCLPAIVKHRAEIPSTLGYDNHPMRVTDVYGEPAVDWPTPEKPVHVACPWMTLATLGRTDSAMRSHRAPTLEPRIAFASPSKGGNFTEEYVSSLWQTALRIRAGQLDWIKIRFALDSVDVIRARARFQDFFLTQTDCNVLAWVDDDMQWTPEAVIGAAAACHNGKDVIGIPYPQKATHWERVEKAVLAGRHPETFTSDYPLWKLPNPEGDGECCTIKSIGMGMLFMSRRAVAAIADEAMLYDVHSGEWFKDFPSEKKIANSYGFKVEPESGQLLSDSHTICWRWRQLAGKLPWCDGKIWMYCGPGSPVNHVGKHVYRGYPEGVIGEVVG